MSYLFVINSVLSSRTARFWKRNQAIVRHYFPDTELHFPESFQSQAEVDLKYCETIVFIGDDIFFNGIVNSIYQRFTENHGKNVLAFIPDSGNSALADGLGLPSRIRDQLELIKCKQTIPMDLVRCHFIDKHNYPASHLILNDILIGLPILKFPLILRHVAERIKSSSHALLKKNRKKITLINDGKIIYEGNYVFALLLLGRKITNGPRIRSKIRINLTKFEYFQLNYQSFKDVASSLPEIFSNRSEDKDQYFIRKKFSELEIKGTSTDNKIIADGRYLGRLPATFTLLPKAIRVISPLIAVQIKTPWKTKLASAKVPKPVGNLKNL
ncbi:MAG: hypothetical protein GY866_14150 [Proteobacteria bacterium]|nr:hypothetical protein [Pseudomonadota bacterium]